MKFNEYYSLVEKMDEGELRCYKKFLVFVQEERETRSLL
jgi:hypothetical protein